MYGPLWRALPGRWSLKLLQVFLILTIVVAICFLWLFPKIAPHLPINENTVGSSHGTAQYENGTPAGS